jgi:putative ABC transport system substrate-binding protein
MRRRDLLLAAAALGAAGPAAAQPARKVRRIGTLGNLPPSDSAARPPWEQFLAALREQGWAEGDNLAVESRWVDGRSDRYKQFADELVALNPEVIVSIGGSLPTQLLKERTTTIPVVMLNTSYPVEAGFVVSLARPGGNITGITNQLQDLTLKNVELMRELVAGLQRFGLIWEPDNVGSRLGAAELRDRFPGIGVTLVSAPLRSADDLDAAFDILARERAEAVLIHATPIASRQRARIIQFAATRRLPTLTPADVHMRAGYLVSYGPDWIDMHRRAAHYVDRILRGASPAELPVEQPTRFHLGFNLQTARAIGLEIPQPLLLRADEVIE